MKEELPSYYNNVNIFYVYNLATSVHSKEDTIKNKCCKKGFAVSLWLQYGIQQRKIVLWIITLW